MTEPLTPQTIETLAAGYVVGNLDPSEVAVFEELLRENPALAEEVNQLQATLNRVAYDLNSIAPPAHLRSAILAAATTPQLTPRHQQLQFPWRTVIGSVAALLILYLGVENYQLRQESKLAQDINTLLQQPQTQLFSLKAVNATNTATGSFVVNLGQRQGVLSVQNLAPPPANKVYRLWAIADGEKIPCGKLNTNSQGKVLEKFWMPADFYDTGISGLFVTLESSESSRYPTGPIVLQSGVSAKRYLF
ncbi:anti-sigma factor domain-containing protein [Aerosakkonemataceae cyanobacterium BLCC-F50]|uniref:Regulator of SigK n=2 Tax=Floridanema TaxID=3396149 RepID=A0ABV4XS05_9CYAN